jgi:hypothetical protein
VEVKLKHFGRNEDPKRVGVQHLQKQSKKYFERNKDPQERRGSVFVKTKLKTFQKERKPQREQRLRIWWKPRSRPTKYNTFQNKLSFTTH